ncbi:uncharacterized protein BDV14DRAFT_71004 [Aspergillus stella-maris]|uniref:uncharacterized protein n=1 Tax=Aspergillus stella-maris TaxID=1810926 RepID=UPI003CCDB441
MNFFALFSLLSLSTALSIPPINNNGYSNSNSDTPSSSSIQSVPTLKINHGTLIPPTNKNISQIKPLPPVQTLNASYTIALSTSQSPYQFFERYADEFFALGLLLLVPITLGLVELVERFARSMSVEEFPERGRDVDRVGEGMRGEWLAKRKGREMIVEKNKPWWRVTPSKH